MKSEDTKYNDLINNKNKSGEEENDIRSRLRKNPNKTKLLYTDDFNAPKSKKKNDNSSMGEKDICRSILEIIKKDEKSALFRQPAIRAFIDPEDKEYYKRQIKEPRDLGYITKKLRLNDYTPKNFYDDLELCWSNAILFNENNTEAYQYAIYLKGMAHKLYKEKGLIDILNKGKESKKEKEKDNNKEKDSISNNNSSLNENTNDSSHSPIKNTSKGHKKVKNNTKTKKENDKSEKNESTSSSNFSNYTKINRKVSNNNNNNNVLQNNNEIKNSKMIGKKRKRSKIKDNKIIEKKEEKREDKKEDKKEEKDENKEENYDEKSEEKSEKSEKKREQRNNSEEKFKKSKKRGRKKKSKPIINNKSIQESKRSSPEKLLSMDDIKNKDQFSHKIVSRPKDLYKILQKNHKKTSIKINNPHPQFYQKSIIQNHINKSKHINQNNNSINNINSNNNYNNIGNNINNNNINNSNNNNINIEETRKVFYQLMMEFFNNNKNAIFPNMFFPEFSSQINSFNQKSYGNSFVPYNPMKYISENNEMANYDNNCNTENVYNIDSNSKRKNISSQEVNYNNNCNPKNIHNISSNSKKKKISGKETNNKKTIIQNTQTVNNIDSVNSTNSVNDGKNSCNDSTVCSLVKTFDKKEDRNLQLRIEIAKYFDNLTDDEMVEVLVYIENIRPQSIKVLANNTIYVDMEAFNEETFDKVFSYVKNMINKI